MCIPGVSLVSAASAKTDVTGSVIDFVLPDNVLADCDEFPVGYILQRLRFAGR